MAQYLAVDWDATELRLVLASFQRGSIRILKAESAPLEAENGPDGTQNIDVGLMLKQLVKRHKVPSAPLLLGLNRASVDMMTFRLPKSKPEDLPDLVKNQALRDSPAFTETSPIDFMTSPAPDGDYLRAIAATVSKTQLKQYRGICQAAGLRAKRIVFRPLALAELYWSSSGGRSMSRSVSRSMSRSATHSATHSAATHSATALPSSALDETASSSADQPVLLVQCTQSEVDMVVVEETNVAFIRSIKLPESLSDEEQTSRIAAEIARTIAVSRQEVEGTALEKVILYGHADEYTALQERLADLEIEAVVQNPFQLPCVVAPAKAKITGVSAEPGHYAALFGMILSEQSKSPVRIDFLHPREKPQPLNIARFVVLFLLLVGVIGYGAYLWNRQHLNQLQVQLAGLNTDIEKLSVEYQQLNPRYVQLLNASSWESRQLIWLDELRDISVRLPDEQDMVIHQIRFFISQPYCTIDLLARVRDTSIIQQIVTHFQSDRNHIVTIADQRPVDGGGGYPIFCSIRIQIAKRDQSHYLYYLTPELRQFSQQLPVFPSRVATSGAEAGNREQEAGNRGQEAGNREQEAGNRDQEAESNEMETENEQEVPSEDEVIEEGDEENHLEDETNESEEASLLTPYPFSLTPSSQGGVA